MFKLYSGALCYAELGTIIKESGGDYTYLHFAYGSVVSYTNSWVNNLLVRPASQTIITLTCAQYVITLFFDDGCGKAPEGIAKLLAIVVLRQYHYHDVYNEGIASFFSFVVCILGGVYATPLNFCVKLLSRSRFSEAFIFDFFLLKSNF